MAESEEESEMFRCDNCGSGYSAQAASSLDSCPRCLAKEGTRVALSFELGWHRASDAQAGASGAEMDRPVGPAAEAAAAAG